MSGRLSCESGKALEGALQSVLSYLKVSWYFLAVLQYPALWGRRLCFAFRSGSGTSSK
jgi:hypothetical protein